MFVPTALHNSVRRCSGHSQVLDSQFSCETAEYHLPEIPHVRPLPLMTNLPLIETRLMSAFGASHYAEAFCKQCCIAVKVPVASAHSAGHSLSLIISLLHTSYKPLLFVDYETANLARKVAEHSFQDLSHIPINFLERIV